MRLISPPLAITCPWPAVRADDGVLVAERGADTSGDRLLADVQVNETGQLSLTEERANRLLKAANAQDPRINVQYDFKRHVLMMHLVASGQQRLRRQRQRFSSP